MNFMKEVIFTDKKTATSQKGNLYANLRTDDNFFVSCFDEEVIEKINIFLPTKCLLKLTNGNRENGYKKSLVLLAVLDGSPEEDNY